MTLAAVLALIVGIVATLYLVGYEATRYVFWWRYHDRFAWWRTWREERNRPS